MTIILSICLGIKLQCLNVLLVSNIFRLIIRFDQNKFLNNWRFGTFYLDKNIFFIVSSCNEMKKRQIINKKSMVNLDKNILFSDITKQYI